MLKIRPLSDFVEKRPVLMIWSLMVMDLVTPENQKEVQQYFEKYVISNKVNTQNELIKGHLNDIYLVA